MARQANGGGTVTGSAGAFLVLEEAGHAKARGAKAYAKLTGVVSALGGRDESVDYGAHRRPPATPVGACWRGGDFRCHRLRPGDRAGIRQPAACRLGEQTPIRALTTMIGNPMEANFPAAVALAALAIAHDGFYPPFEKAEIAATAAPSAIVVSMVGHYRGEGLGLVERI